MNHKVVLLSIVLVLVVVGSIVFLGGQRDQNQSEQSDLRYDYDETLYYSAQGPVPYGDDHLFKIKVWNKSKEMVNLPMHFKYVLNDGKEIVATGVGYNHYNTNGATLVESIFDPDLHTTLMSGEIETYECVIHVSGYNSKLDGQLICTDAGWKHHNL